MRSLIDILIILNECKVKPTTEEMKFALGKDELPTSFKHVINKIEREISWQQR